MVSRTDNRKCRARDGEWRQNISHIFSCRAHVADDLHWLKGQTVQEELPISVRIILKSQKSLHRLMLGRNRLGLLVNPLCMLDVLVTASGTNCADPRSTSWFGRMAERSPLTLPTQVTDVLWVQGVW